MEENVQKCSEILKEEGVRGRWGFLKDETEVTIMNNSYEKEKWEVGAETTVAA